MEKYPRRDRIACGVARQVGRGDLLERGHRRRPRKVPPRKTGSYRLRARCRIRMGEAMVRLRKYVASRAKKSDLARVQEGEMLLAPLLDAMAKLKAEAKTRATKRTKPAEDPAPKPEAPPA